MPYRGRNNNKARLCIRFWRALVCIKVGLRLYENAGDFPSVVETVRLKSFGLLFGNTLGVFYLGSPWLRTHFSLASHHSD